MKQKISVSRVRKCAQRQSEIFRGFKSKNAQFSLKHANMYPALEGIENKQRLQTLSIDNAWSNKIFLFYSTFRMLQHTSSEVNGYNCYKHFKEYKNKEGNW